MYYGCMSRVEGAAWRKHQEEDKNSPYGFYAYLEAWRIIEKEGEVGEITPYQVIGMDLVPGVVRGGDGAIYGEGGYSRYGVRRDGEITFDYSMASQRKQALARKEGFR